MTFYLGTIAVSFIGNMIVCLKVAKDVSNEGYKFKEKKKNIFDTILGFVKWFLISAIPIGNVIISGILVFSSDKLSKSFIKDSVRKGVLVSKEQPSVIEEVELDNNLVEDSKVVVYKVDNAQKREMTREEKLEFLRQEYERLTGEELTSKLDDINPSTYGLNK